MGHQSIYLSPISILGFHLLQPSYTIFTKIACIVELLYIHMISKILLIEDDLDLQKYLEEFLRDNDFAVTAEGLGAGGLAKMDKIMPNLVLLDLNLPDIQGEEVCARIHEKYPDIPIIILTAKGNTSDKVKGLGMGAVDYVTKPFSGEELLARIKTHLRSVNGEATTLVVADLQLDTKTIEVKRGDELISLTPQEFKLLEYLMKNKGIVLTRDTILNRIWLYSPDVESRVVDVYIGYLRKKIDKGQKQKLIHSVRGFGYTIKV